MKRSVILDVRERLEIERYLERSSLPRVDFLRRGETIDSCNVIIFAY